MTMEAEVTSDARRNENEAGDDGGMHHDGDIESPDVAGHSVAASVTAMDVEVVRIMSGDGNGASQGMPEAPLGEVTLVSPSRTAKHDAVLNDDDVTLHSTMHDGDQVDQGVAEIGGDHNGDDDVEAARSSSAAATEELQEEDAQQANLNNVSEQGHDDDADDDDSHNGDGTHIDHAGANKESGNLADLESAVAVIASAESAPLEDSHATGNDSTNSLDIQKDSSDDIQSPEDDSDEDNAAPSDEVMQQTAIMPMPPRSRIEIAMDANNITAAAPRHISTTAPTPPAPTTPPQDAAAINNGDANNNGNANDDGNGNVDDDRNNDFADDLTVKTLPIDMDETAPADVNLPPQEYHQNGGFGFAMYYDHNDDDDDDHIVLRPHIFCGILCDCRRACIMIDLISLLSTLIAFASYITAILDQEYNGDYVNGDDDEVLSTDSTTRIIIILIYFVSLMCYALGIRGAVRYNYIFVSIAACRYIVEIVAAGILLNYATAVVGLLFLYPHIVFAYELWQDIITPITYPYQEYSCCCRTNAAMIAMEMERRRRQRLSGRRQRRRQR